MRMKQGAVPKGQPRSRFWDKLPRISGMKKRSHNRVVFKPYVQGQLQMPSDLDELVPVGHLVRVVDGAIERMDLKPLLRRYAGGGTSSYHPKMML